MTFRTGFDLDGLGDDGRATLRAAYRAASGTAAQRRAILLDLIVERYAALPSARALQRVVGGDGGGWHLTVQDKRAALDTDREQGITERAKAALPSVQDLIPDGGKTVADAALDALSKALDGAIVEAFERGRVAGADATERIHDGRLESLRVQVEQFRAEAIAAAAAEQAVFGQLAKLEQEVEHLRIQRDAARTGIEHAREQLTVATEAQAHTRARLEAVTAERDELSMMRIERAEAIGEVRVLRSRVDEALAERDAARDELKALQSKPGQ